MRKFLPFFFAAVCVFLSDQTYAQLRQIYLSVEAENQVESISFFNQSQGYVAFDKWLGYTQDSGHTFTRKYIDYQNVAYGSYNVNLTFGFTPKGVYAISRDSLLLYGHYGFVPAILFSTDQGNTFKLVFHSAFNNEATLADGIKQMVFPSRGATGYAIDAYRILKTTNGGASWSVIKMDANTSLQFLTTSLGFATGLNSVSKTNNGGVSWTPVGLPSMLSSAIITSTFFLTENKGWINISEDGKNKTYMTINGGAQWTTQSITQQTDYSLTKLHFSNDSTGYGLSYSFDVYKTTDAGKYWERIKRSTDYTYLNYSNNDIFFSSDKQFWVGGGHGSLELSTNAGEPTYPKAAFETDVSGLNTSKTVILHNRSKQGYIYKWFKNSTLFASTYNASYVSNRLLVDTVQMVVIKGNLSDTASVLIDTREVQEPCNSAYNYLVDTSLAKFTSLHNTNNAKHYWNFGDGTSDTSSVNPQHVYTRSGFYDVQHLVVNTVDGCRDSSSQSVYIGRLKNCLEVDITAEADPFFTNKITFGYTLKEGSEEGAAWNPVWDFGDSTIGDNPIHYYDSSKFYTVKLSLSHYSTGCSTIVYKPVFVYLTDSCDADFKIYTLTDPEGFSIGPGVVRFYPRPNLGGKNVNHTWIFNNEDTVLTSGNSFIEKKLYEVGYYGNDLSQLYGTCSSVTLDYDLNKLKLGINHIITNNKTKCQGSKSLQYTLPVVKKIYIRAVPDPQFANYVTFYAYSYNNFGVDSMPYYSPWMVDGGFSSALTNTRTEFFPDSRTHRIAISSPECNSGTRDVFYINYNAPDLPPCSIYPPYFNYSIDPVQPSLVRFWVDYYAEQINKQLGWDVKFYFGTGDSVSAREINYNFPQPGIYTVTLRYTNARGCIKEISKQITIAATCKLQAAFTATPVTANPFTYNFKNNTQPDTATVSYKWYFGSGDSSTAKSPTYTFPNGGTYKVRLIATRSEKCVSAKDTSIVIAATCNIKADFSYKLTDTVKNIVTFSNLTSPDTSGTTYKWSFGTGDSSSLKNPAYGYPGYGSYNVKLVAYKGFCTSTKDTLIVIAKNFVSISSFSPQYGPVGTMVTISGNNFVPDPLGNIVYFGAVRAVVHAATVNSLLVSAPAGSTFKPLTVTTNKFTAYSAQPFNLTFASADTALTSASFVGKTDLAVGGTPTGVIGVDLNSDSKADIATSNFNSSPKYIAAIKNSSAVGSLNFSQPQQFTTRKAQHALASADFDGDGKIDIVAAMDDDYYGVTVLKNTSENGVISFATPTLIPLNTFGGFHVVTGDINDDGKPDLVVVGYFSNRMSVLLNTSSNQNVSFDTYNYSIPGSPYAATIGDFDGDSKPDIAIAASNAQSIFDHPQLTIFKNNSEKGKFFLVAYQNIGISYGCNDICSGDLNGDGRPEIIALFANVSKIGVFKNSSAAGAISFIDRVDFATGNNPANVAIGDVNGDGRPDLISANQDAGTVSVLRNTGKNGTINFDQKIDFAAGAGAQRLSVGDLDGDGQPEISVANAGTISILRNTIVKKADTCNLVSRFSRSGSTTAPASTSFLNQTTPDSSTIYKWYFGTGDSSSVKNPSYTYTAPGTYYVRLTATRAACTSTSTDTVVITAPPVVCTLQARFSRSGSTTAPASISFLNQTTPDSSTIYKWYFGTGDSSSVKNPSYTYTAPGTYYVRLTATRAACTSTSTDTVVITAPPVVCTLQARFSRSGSTTAPASISFLNQTTPDSSTIYKWYFGTGDSSSVKNPSYIYTAPGTYYVRLTATRAACTSTSADTVVITAPPAVCNLKAKFEIVGNAIVNQSISFFNQTLSGTLNTSYTWYFGNGDSSASTNPSHVYAMPGTYLVKLVATENAICRSEVTKTVQVSPAATCSIKPNFLFFADTMQANKISFINETEPNSGAFKYYWKLGDGYRDSSQSPQHVYSLAGDYNVCLQVIESASCIKTVCKNVSISLPRGKFTISPNPVKAKLTLYMLVDVGETYVIRFVNSAGNVAKEVKLDALPGANYLHVSVADFAPGFYFVTAESNTSKYQTQVLKF